MTRSNLYYEVTYYNGVGSVRTTRNFLSLDAAIDICEEDQIDYIDLDGRLHHYSHADSTYVVCDPEDFYEESEEGGYYLKVWNFYEREFSEMFEDATSDNVFIVVED